MLFCPSCAANRSRISVTAILIAINVLVYVAMALDGVSPITPTGEELVKWGASFGPYELSTEWWRVFTAMFVHIGVLHILLNMLCLMNLGPLAERLFGPWKFLLMYLLSGIGGNVASVALHPSIVAAGASGAIFGVAGALLPVIHLRQIPAIVSLRGRGGKLGIGGFIIYNLLYGFGNQGIDNAAHVGGLLIGFVIGYALPVAGSHVGRAAVWRTQGVLLATTLVLGGAFVGVRRWRSNYGEVLLARRDFRADHYAAGIERLQRLLRRQPKNHEARVLLGAAYLDQARASEAVHEFQRALEDDSTDASVYDHLGDAYLKSKQWEQAVAAYKHATQLDSLDGRTWGNLGAAHLHWEHGADAIAPIRRAIELEPDTARHHYNLGLAYRQTKQYQKALTSFNQTVRLRPTYTQVFLERGYVNHLLGRLDSARADYRRVVDAPPGTISDEFRADARRLLGQLSGH